MQLNSILLAVTPSANSKNAAQLSWRMSEVSDARIDAIHVVDVPGAWAIMGYDEPGFMGSGLQVAGYQNLVAALKEVGTKLAEVYDAHASGRNIDSELNIVEGSPCSEILSRANSHDLVVVGHRRTASNTEHSRYSVVEILASKTDRPLLVVQDQCQFWDKVKLVVPLEKAGCHFVNDCLDFASQLGLECEIVGLVFGDTDDCTDRLAALQSANPRFADLKVAIHVVKSDILNEGSWGWWKAQQSVEADESSHTLEIMPILIHGKQRLTALRTPVSYFVGHLGASAILFWPEHSSQGT